MPTRRLRHAEAVERKQSRAAAKRLHDVKNNYVENHPDWITDGVAADFFAIIEAFRQYVFASCIAVQVRLSPFLPLCCIFPWCC
jgi:hypothetical protein